MRVHVCVWGRAPLPPPPHTHTLHALVVKIHLMCLGVGVGVVVVVVVLLGIVLDGWFFPIRDEDLTDDVTQPILFVNTGKKV